MWLCYLEEEVIQTDISGIGYQIPLFINVFEDKEAGCTKGGHRKTRCSLQCRRIDNWCFGCTKSHQLRLTHAGDSLGDNLTSLLQYLANRLFWGTSGCLADGLLCLNLRPCCRIVQMFDNEPGEKEKSVPGSPEKYRGIEKFCRCRGRSTKTRDTDC